MKKLLTTGALLLCSLLTSFAQFSGSGSGTTDDPYKIFYGDQLNELRNFLNQSGVYFKLMNNLDLSDWISENYPSQGWQPVGSASTPFKGILDGNGKTISGFSITRASTDYVGLFAVVDGATIKNLTLKGDIKGNGYVGSLFGSGSATVTNYTFEGTVTGTGNYVGGVGGSQSAASSTITVRATVNGTQYTGGIYGKGADLTSASFTGQKVTGTSYVGGLEGQGSGTFSSCTVVAPVTGTSSYVGGLVGYADRAITFQNNCTQQGNVTGTLSIGGLVGHTSSSFTANNCSQKGDINGTGNYVGGLVGRTSSSSTASNCKHEGSVSGQQYTGGSVGYTESNITLNNSTQRGNVTGTTQTGGIIGYAKNGAVSLTSCFAEGDITGTTSVGGICGQIQDPGSSSISACSFWGNISGESQLGGVVGDISVNSTSSIDFNATTTAGYPKYTGTTTGYSYSRTACFHYISSPDLFADANGGYVKSSNSIVQDSEISAWVKSTGSVYCQTASGNVTSRSYPKVVYNNITGTSTSSNINVNILNCSAVGNINGTGTYIGGIVGNDMSGIFKTFTLSATKSIYYYKGNGYNTSTTSLTLKKYNISNTRETCNINESYYSGNLTGTNYIGGIAGNKQGGCINNCYASGSISGVQYVGGIAGSLSKESLNTNENSLNANASICTSITGTSNVGKIYGATDGNFSVAALGTNSENRSVANMQLIIGGVGQALNDNLQNGTAVGISQLRRRASYVAWGWNVNDYWKIIDTESFPYKTWQAAPPIITGSLVSGSTSITGNSVDGGTVYIKIGEGNWRSVNCSGTTFTLSGIAKLQAGSVVQLYAKTSYKKASYINQYTVGYAGSGTEADPWRVYTAEDLQGVYKAGYYKQMNDIDLTSWISANSASTGWVPVGYGGTDPVTYDGDNHKVTGLWTNTTNNYTGLFSSFNNGTIRNLTVQVATNKQVKGGDYTGIVIGRIGEGTIENVTVTGNVQGGNNTGGIVGYSTSTMLKNLSYSGQVTGTGATSGITAYASGQPVTACQVTASTIKSTGGNVGGLIAAGNASVSQCKVTGTTVNQTGTGSGIYVAGLTANVTGAVTQCLADATVSNASASGYTAGLAAKSSSTIKECSATGSVTSTRSNTKTGGLVAETTSGSTIEDCYSTANVSGTQYTAGLVGYNYGKVNRCYASGDVNSIYIGSGLVGYNDGASAVVTNCVALGSKVGVSDQTGWSIRVIGGYTNGAPDPDESNYAWIGMQISVNGVPKTIQDNILDGQSLSDAQIKQQSTYTALSWDFDNVWTMPSDSYPVLQWQVESTEPEVMKGDLNGDGEVKINDVVLIIYVIAGIITDANQVAAADVNNDGSVMINDCVAAIYLIAGQVSTPNSARRKAHTLLSDTEYISGAMENNLLTISLDNEKRYTAFQMIVSVPDGMTLGKATMDEMRGAGHQAIIRNLGGGQYLVAGFSGDNEELTGSSGRLLSIATNGQATGDIVISDIEFATTQAEAYYLADEVVSTIATGINEMKNEELRIKNDVYDLQGRRVMNPTKGLYIVNGKKVNLK